MRLILLRAFIIWRSRLRFFHVAQDMWVRPAAENCSSSLFHSLSHQARACIRFFLSSIVLLCEALAVVWLMIFNLYSYRVMRQTLAAQRQFFSSNTRARLATRASAEKTFDRKGIGKGWRALERVSRKCPTRRHNVKISKSAFLCATRRLSD